MSDVEHAGWAVGGPGSRLRRHRSHGARRPAGRNLVTCRHVPFGRVRTRNRQEHPFVVERGSPGDGLGGLWLLFGGSAALVLGIAAGMRWRTGTLRPR